jgi:[acyl-carrier-protein] S-malonyltransferase
LTVSHIAFRLLGAVPDIAAGHSLGEYSALVAAGCLEFEDALRLVHNRGLYMQEAVPVGRGAMAAVMGSSFQAVEDALKRVGGIVQVANWNSDDQIVIAGEKHAVDAALENLREARSVMLPVSAPFHCTLMKGAEDRLSADLDVVEFKDLKFPVVTNVDARLIWRGEDARDALKRQVSRPVLWQKTMAVLGREGVDTVVEVGPGRVLLGLLRRGSGAWPRRPNLFNVEDGDSLARCRGVLSGPA